MKSQKYDINLDNNRKNKKTRKHNVCGCFMAERVGFEPTWLLHQTVFKTASL